MLCYFVVDLTRCGRSINGASPCSHKNTLIAWFINKWKSRTARLRYTCDYPISVIFEMLDLIVVSSDFLLIVFTCEATYQETLGCFCALLFQ